MKDVRKVLCVALIAVVFIFLIGEVSTAQNYNLDWQLSLNLFPNKSLIMNNWLYKNSDMPDHYFEYPALSFNTSKDFSTSILGGEMYHSYPNNINKLFNWPYQQTSLRNISWTVQPTYSMGYDFLNLLNEVKAGAYGYGGSIIGSGSGLTYPISGNIGQKAFFYINPTMNSFALPWQKQISSEPATPTKEDNATNGLMILIEYEGIEGLTNFVYELYTRGIPSVLLSGSDFVTEHCEEIKKLQKYGMEVIANCGAQLWGIPYEEQYEIIKNAKDSMEACLGRPLRIVGSRYMASDENTVRVAHELGIPYVLARGTTGTRATIYQPEGFDVKIISVSNMESERWAYGSLCDYSVWARGGTPEEFSSELYGALQHDRICTVSHTCISGLKAAWYEVYMDFLDNSGVEYLDIDSFTANADITKPVSEIPQNRNVPYASQPYPLVPLDEEPDVDNPCAIDSLPPKSYTEGLLIIREKTDIDALINFVYETQKRDIPVFLGVSEDFCLEHQEDIKRLFNYGVDSICALTGDPLWDVPYEEQYEIMSNAKNTIEACLGKPVRCVSSKHFGYNEDTIKIAEELDIDYVLIRGVTGSKSTIYKPEEYNVKMLSVSRVEYDEEIGGTLCDTSFSSKGTVEEYKEKLYGSLQYDKISPVVHPKVSGVKAGWLEVYCDFFDNAGVKWVDLDEFGTIDISLPYAEIPYEKKDESGSSSSSVPSSGSSIIPLEEQPDVETFHTFDDFPPKGNVGDKIVMFHNNTGPMCLEAIAFLDIIQYPIEEHLTNEAGFWDSLDALKADFGSSEGISDVFGFFPIIFIKDKAFSGFDDSIRDEILGII